MDIHQKILAIERWCSPSHIQNVVEKTGGDNWKVRKTSWTLNQTPNPKPKHDKIQTRWASDIFIKKHVGKGMIM